MGDATLSHLFVLVSDLPRSKAFYTEMLGLDVLMEEDGYVRIGGGGGFHIGMEQGRPERAGGCGIEISVRVPDVDATYERLSAMGIEFRQPPEDMPWGARHAFLEDPDGYRLSIYAPLG